MYLGLKIRYKGCNNIYYNHYYITLYLIFAYLKARLLQEAVSKMDPYYNALYNTKFAFLQDFFDGLIYEVVLKIEALRSVFYL